MRRGEGTVWRLAFKGGLLAFLLNFGLVLALSPGSLLVLSLMNYGSTAIGGLYSGKRASYRESYQGLLAGLVKGFLDQSLMIFMGKLPNLLVVGLCGLAGLGGGFAAIHLYGTRKGRKT